MATTNKKKLSQLATILKQIDDAITKLSDTGDDDLCKVQTFDDQGLKHTAQAKKKALSVSSARATSSINLIQLNFSSSIFCNLFQIRGRRPGVGESSSCRTTVQYTQPVVVVVVVEQKPANLVHCQHHMSS